MACNAMVNAIEALRLHLAPEVRVLHDWNGSK